jgi:hypothetical protein
MSTQTDSEIEYTNVENLFSGDDSVVIKIDIALSTNHKYVVKGKIHRLEPNTMTSTFLSPCDPL